MNLLAWACHRFDADILAGRIIVTASVCIIVAIAMGWLA